jgi:nucleoside-diphosphate-sugar epimerase
MRIVLTGAAGFLGRECLAQLKAGSHDVVTTDRIGEVDVRGDLADEAFCRSLPECDAVVHAAAVQYVSRDLPLRRRERYFARNNVEATRNLCARYAGKPTHFVQVGTSMMYRQSGLASYGTASPMDGQGVYSRSKLAAQEYVRRLPNPTATVIPCIIGGRGREGLFRGFVNLMTRYGIVVFPGTGEHRVHMVHVEDVAALIALVVDRRAEGMFNAAAPEPLSIQGWIDEIEDELGLGAVRRMRLPLAPIRWLSALSGYRLLAREQLLMLAQSHVLSIDESIALGWKPRHTNARIARDIARYVAETT